MYGPATSLALLANLNDKLCVGLLGFIGTFYTTIGGIRGVIWNDLFQALVMFTSLGIIIIKGIIDAGGFGDLWETNANGGRLNFFDFNPDPFIRQSFWSLVFGQIIYMSMSFCFDQQMIQRFQVKFFIFFKLILFNGIRPNSVIRINLRFTQLYDRLISMLYFTPSLLGKSSEIYQ